MYKYDYTRYRNVLGFEKSQRFLIWVKKLFPNTDLHHILGSTIGKKFTDYLVVPLPHRFHLEVVEYNRAKYFDKYLPKAVWLLLQYASVELLIDKKELEQYETDYEPETIKKLIELVHGKEKETYKGILEQVKLLTKLILFTNLKDNGFVIWISGIRYKQKFIKGMYWRTK